VHPRWVGDSLCWKKNKLVWVRRLKNQKLVTKSGQAAKKARKTAKTERTLPLKNYRRFRITEFRCANN
jgi:hypothetical protein